jgi:hypothetical protein
MVEIPECQVAHVVVFCPKPDENVYSQWFKDDPSEGAEGPVFQFFTVSTPDEDVYTQLGNQVTKFACEDCDVPLLDALLALSESLSEQLGISEQAATETMKFLEALLSDEADDLDDSRFDYRWVGFPNAFLGFNNELGSPENRVHIKVKSSQFSGTVSASIGEDSLVFDTDDLGLALAISQFEQGD